ncbi:hypothetical protein [Actibacterium sp. D379-3]
MGSFLVGLGVGSAFMALSLVLGAPFWVAIAAYVVAGMIGTIGTAVLCALSNSPQGSDGETTSASYRSVPARG